MNETYRFRCEDAFGDYDVPEITTRIDHDDDPIEVVKGIATRTERAFEDNLEELDDPENQTSARGILHGNVENTLEELGLLRWTDVDGASDPTFIEAMDFLDRLDQDGEIVLAPMYSSLLIRAGQWSQFRKYLWSKTLFRVVAAAAEEILYDRDWGYLLDQQPTHAHTVQFTLDVLVEPEDLAGVDGTHPRDKARHAALAILHDSPAFDSAADFKEVLEFAGVNVR